jgi:alpha/beta superfamily hydrolase
MAYSMIFPQESLNLDFRLREFHKSYPAMQKLLSLVVLILVVFSFTDCSNKEKRLNNLIDTLDSPEQFSETDIILETETAYIHGTLNSSKLHEPAPLVIIIAGSGPTDRNGNNTSGVKTDAYKMISDTLAMHGIASLRYDKRGIGESYYMEFREEDLRFEDYVQDALQWIEKMQHDGWFSNIFILGHSEGSLIGLLAAQNKTISGIISVAGPAQTADKFILKQLAGQPKEILTETESIIKSLKQGILVQDVSQNLYALFRPGIQPYLISWFSYNPVEEVSKIKVPLLIMHGTTDLQVNSSEALTLANSNSKAELAIIDLMNHVLKDAGDDIQFNLATYSNPTLPLNAEFCKVLTNFIKENSDQ